MQLPIKKPPFVRRGESVATMMNDTLLALVLLLPLPAVYYGTHVLKIAVSAVVACFVSEIVACLLAKRQIDISELSSVVTALIIAMLMPPNAPLWLPALAGVFAVLVARAPFGFTGNNPFNPAAAGIAFVTAFFPGAMFTYPHPSPAAALKAGLKPEIIPSEMLWGTIGGPIGATAALVIGACAVYLVVKRAANWRVMLCFLAAAALFALFFPRIMVSPMTSLKYELLSGSLLFCAVFMMTDPVTGPRTELGSMLYGILGGVLLMLMRRYGVYEQAACFTVLIMNAFAPVIDNAVFALKAGREKAREKQE